MSTPLTGDGRTGAPHATPHWLIRLVGVVHLAGYRLTGGRLGLSRPTPARWGHMCLTTTGRRTGTKRHAMLGYFEDGRNLVALAVNAWADPEPAWSGDPGCTCRLEYHDRRLALQPGGVRVAVRDHCLAGELSQLAPAHVHAAGAPRRGHLSASSVSVGDSAPTLVRREPAPKPGEVERMRRKLAAAA